MANGTIRVCVIEDHPVIREGIAQLLAPETDIQLVGQYGSAEAALRDIPSVRPDLVATNVGIPGGDGLDLCRHLRGEYPDIRVLMVTLNSELDTVLSAFRSGASGYLLKEHADRFCQAARTIMAGHVYLDPALSPEVLQAVRRLFPDGPIAC